MLLTPCPHCSRHVRRTEAQCPFCARAIGADRGPILRSPTHRLGRAAMAAFGAAAVSTSVAACGARGGLEIGAPPRPIDAGIDADWGCCSADYGGPPFPTPLDAAIDGGSFVGAYGAPSFPDAAMGPIDGGLEPDMGASHAEYGGPPFEEDAGADKPVYGGPPEP